MRWILLLVVFGFGLLLAMLGVRARVEHKTVTLPARTVTLPARTVTHTVIRQKVRTRTVFLTRTVVEQAGGTSGIPQNNGGDRDNDNNGGPSDGDGNI